MARRERVEGAPHGTVGGYTNWRCGCLDCADAFAAWQKNRRYEREQMLKANFNIVEHGKVSTYGNWRCRCDDCTEAWRIDSRERRERRKTQPTRR